jgi:hypothetical protein
MSIGDELIITRGVIANETPYFVLAPPLSERSKVFSRRQLWRSRARFRETVGTLNTFPILKSDQQNILICKELRFNFL